MLTVVVITSTPSYLGDVLTENQIRKVKITFHLNWNSIKQYSSFTLKVYQNILEFKIFDKGKNYCYTIEHLNRVAHLLILKASHEML